MVLPYLTSMYTTPITSGGVHGENAKPPALILLASHPPPSLTLYTSPSWNFYYMYLCTFGFRRCLHVDSLLDSHCDRHFC